MSGIGLNQFSRIRFGWHWDWNFRMQRLCGSGGLRCEFVGVGVVGSGEAQRFGESRRSGRVLRVCAGENKRQPNFIDIGGARRDGWDEVKVVRTTSPAPERKTGKKAEPARSPVSLVDVEPQQQSLIVEATKRGRGGKTVTVIKGLQLRVESLEALCKSLKVKMGSGGAVKDGEIEIQGDHAAKLVEELLKLGFKAKKSGR